MIWDDFCSWYLEWIKPGFEQPIEKKVYEKTVYFFEELMQLLHPFMPFITEEIYHQLKKRDDGEDLTIKQFSAPKADEPAILEQGRLLKEIITGLRDARNKNNIKPKETIRLFAQTGNKKNYQQILSILSKQVNAESIEFVNDKVVDSIAAVIGKDKFYIQSEQGVQSESQKEDLEKELQYLQGFLASVDKKLNNERFVQNAKPEVVELEKRKKADAEAKIKMLEESLASL